MLLIPVSAYLLIASVIAVSIDLLSTSKIDDKIKIEGIGEDSNHVEVSNDLTSLHMFTSDLDNSVTMHVRRGASCRIYSPNSDPIVLESGYLGSFDHSPPDFYIVAKLPSHMSYQSTGNWPADYSHVREWAGSMSNISISLDYFAVFHIVRSLPKIRSTLSWLPQHRFHPYTTTNSTPRRVKTNSKIALELAQTPSALNSESETSSKNTTRRGRIFPTETNHNNRSKEGEGRAQNNGDYCLIDSPDSDEIIEISDEEEERSANLDRIGIANLLN